MYEMKGKSLLSREKIVNIYGWNQCLLVTAQQKWLWFCENERKGNKSVSCLKL